MDRKSFHLELEALGEEEVRRRVSTGFWTVGGDWAEEWLRLKDWEKSRSQRASERRHRISTITLSAIAIMLSGIAISDKIAEITSQFIVWLRGIF